MKKNHTKEGEASGFATVDLSNILTEGQRLAAVKRGLVKCLEDAEHRNVRDASWRVDAVKLYRLIAGECPLKDALVFGSYAHHGAPSLEGPFKFAGFRTDFRPRNRFNREKAVDLSVLSLFASMFQRGNPKSDDLTHVGGDGDHLPVIEQGIAHGFAVDVIGFRHATSRQLIAAARRFIPLDDFFDFIGFYHEKK